MVQMTLRAVKATAVMRRTGNASTAGFSLIEQMVVLVVIAGLATVAASLVPAARERAQYREALADLVHVLRATRSTAIRERRVTRFVMNVAERSFMCALCRLDGRFDGETQLSFRTSAGELLDRDQAALAFYPDGSSSGGAFVISRNAVTWIVSVNWLTGDVRYSAGATVALSAQGGDIAHDQQKP